MCSSKFWQRYENVTAQLQVSAISENVESIYKSLRLSLKYFANICRRMITFELPVIPSDHTNQFKCMWMMKDIKLENVNLGDRHVSEHGREILKT